MSLAEFRLRRWDARREIEWKLSIAFWGLLVATAAAPVKPPQWLAGATLIVAVVVYGWGWVWQIFQRNREDQHVAFSYIERAERVLPLESPGSFSRDDPGIGWAALFQIATTVLLAISAWYVLTTKSVSPPLTGGAPEGESLATITDHSRDAAQVRGFLRIRWLGSGEEVKKLGGDAAFRVFVTDVEFFRPPLPLKEVLRYLGLPSSPPKPERPDLVAIRCNVPTNWNFEPVLATWPNVLPLVKQDLINYAHSGHALSPAEQKLSKEPYKDTPDDQGVLSAPVKAALERGATLLRDKEQSAALRQRWGIYPEFSGVGFTIAGSSYADHSNSTQLRAAQILRQSIVPEYLVKNITLGGSGCACMRFSPYAGHESTRLDVDNIRGRCQGTASTR